MKGEVTTSSVKIDRLRNRIIEGNIKIPPFQREFVWKQEQVIELLDSIVRDFPIGSILLWETKDSLPAKRNIGGFNLPDPTEDYPINYVLDGQQRVTSIFGIFCFDLDREETDEYDPSVFDIHYDLQSQEFVSLKDLEEDKLTLPLKLIFDNYKFNQFIRDNSLNEEQSTQIVELQSIFQNYELPLVTIKKRDKSEVGIIFERVNNTGTPLSTLDLMIAWTWVEDFHLKEKFQEIFETLEDKNFGDIKNKVILQCISAIINKTTKAKKILELAPKEVREQIDNLKSSLEQAIDFVSTQFNCLSLDFLPRVQQIVPLTYLFSKTHRLSEHQVKYIRLWFWKVSFSDRYTASTDQRMDDDIEFMDEILNENFVNIKKYQSTITAEQLLKIKFSKSNSFVRGILLLLSQKSPLDLANGSLVDVGNALSQYNRKQYHHIFPKAFLKDKGLLIEEINKVVNFCILPADSNRLISDKSPSDYFNNVIPKENFSEILNSNLIPNEIEMYNTDNYGDFLDKRSEIFMQEIQALCKE